MSFYRIIRTNFTLIAQKALSHTSGLQSYAFVSDGARLEPQ